MRSVNIAVNAISLMSPLTGIGQYTRHLANELATMPEFRVHLFYGPFWRRHEVEDLAEGWQKQPAARRPATGLPGRLVCWIPGVKRMVKRLIPKPYEVARFLQQGVFNRGVQEFGIRLYHEPNYIPYRFQGPTVITVHDLSLVFYPETHPKDRVQAIGCKLGKAVHSADRIIVVSESVRREVLEVYGLPEDRVVTVHNGVDARFQPQPPERILEVRRRYGLPSGGYLVSVGTLEPRKNIARLISAYRALPKELRSRDPLVLVGMTGWEEDRLKAEFWMLRREGSLIRTGYVADQDLPAIYAGATAFAYPSIYEGFGLPLVEAMACGTAVLTSNCSAMPEVVGNAGLLVDPFDVDSIRDGLFRLLRDEAERERCRMAGLARARRFSWARCARETADAYRSLL